MGGHLIDQPLPASGVDQFDPFLLIHHWKGRSEGGKNPAEEGVGPHPHRGFSPVTFVYEGSVQHRDSLGNNAIVRSGGTQWMHAGRGITHSERPDKDFAINGGIQEFIQFWVNTPSQHKMEEPYYLPLSDEDTPKIVEEDHTFAVVAGKFNGIEGPAKTYSPQTLLRLTANKGAEVKLSLPKDFNTLLYFLDGEAEVSEVKLKAKDMVLFENDAEEIGIRFTENTRVMILSGAPINEPVSSYGPFVMNTQSEIMQALRDAQTGKMGVLVEDFS